MCVCVCVCWYPNAPVPFCFFLVFVIKDLCVFSMDDNTMHILFYILALSLSLSLSPARAHTHTQPPPPLFPPHTHTCFVPHAYVRSLVRARTHQRSVRAAMEQITFSETALFARIPFRQHVDLLLHKHLVALMFGCLLFLFAALKIQHTYQKRRITRTVKETNKRDQ